MAIQRDRFPRYAPILQVQRYAATDKERQYRCRSVHRYELEEEEVVKLEEEPRGQGQGHAGKGGIAIAKENKDWDGIPA